MKTTHRPRHLLPLALALFALAAPLHAAKPVIYQQPPTTITATAGQNTIFGVNADGDPDPTYRWQVSTNGGSTYFAIFNDSTYNYTDRASLTIKNTPASFNGYKYRVSVENTYGTTTSNPVTLTVIPPSPPTFTTNLPSVIGVDAGGTVTLVATATSALPITYKWTVLPQGTLGWTPVSNNANYTGATTNTLTIANTPASFANNHYQCVATNSAGNAYSYSTTLSVHPLIAPAFTMQPANVTIPAGSTDPITFTVSANGYPAPSYQWQHLDNGKWTNLVAGTATLGVNTAALTFAYNGSFPNADGYQVRCLATNTAGTAASNPATITIAPAKPTITTQPQNVTITPGKTATFTIAATGVPAPAYTWYEQLGGSGGWKLLSNTGNYSGATTNKLVISNVTSALNGSGYYCIVANNQGHINSSIATLTVTIAMNTSAAATLAATAKPGATLITTAPLFTKQPTDVTITPGQTATFAIAVTGHPAPALQWQHLDNGKWVNLTPDANTQGVTTATLTLVNVNTNGYQVRCVATNGISPTPGSPSAYSNAATITVKPATTSPARPPKPTLPKK